MANTVLLVEDEIKTAEMLKAALENAAINVVWKQDGMAALAEFKTGRFDLIVLDLKLPKMTGDEVLEKIRAVDPYVSVIVYSNNEDPAVLKKLLNLSVDGFISKGATADLWATVEQIKQHLDPFSEAERKTLLQALPAGAFVNPMKDDE
jgi:DNA-binding response OmpR family regulator